MKTLRKLYKKNYIFGKSIKSQHDANSSLVAWQVSTSHNFLNFLGSLINSVPTKQQLNGFLSGKQLNFSQGNKSLIRSKICNTSKGQQNQFFSAWFDLWCAITFVLLQDSFYGQTYDKFGNNFYSRTELYVKKYHDWSMYQLCKQRLVIKANANLVGISE